MRIGFFLLFTVGIALSWPSRPQVVVGSEMDPAQVSAGRQLFKSRGSCSFCHGWAGDGNGDPRSPGIAANLRHTRLSREELIHVIACGRPGTEMPHFDAEVSSAHGPCYAMSKAPLAGSMPPDPPRPLQPHEIAAVVDYLIAKVIGRSEPTLEECVEFFSETGPCSGYSPSAQSAKSGQ